MPLTIHQGNVLDAPANALLVAVSPDSIIEFGTGGVNDRILGNVARQFRQRWPSAWDEVERSLLEAQSEGGLDLLRPGGSHLVDLDAPDCPFRVLALVASLSHDSAANKRTLAALSLRQGLTELLSEDHLEIATTLPSGGWRLDVETAFGVLIEAFRGALGVLPKEERLDVKVGVWTKDKEIAQTLNKWLRTRLFA